MASPLVVGLLALPVLLAAAAALALRAARNGSERHRRRFYPGTAVIGFFHPYWYAGPRPAHAQGQTNAQHLTETPLVRTCGVRLYPLP